MKTSAAERIARVRALTACLTVLVCAQSALAQPRELDSRRASVRGIVLDDAQQPLPKATVSLPSLQRQTVTDEAGRFQLRELPATELVLEVRRVGYRSDVRRIDLRAERDLSLTLRIARAAVTVAEVVVTGNAAVSERRGAQDVAALNERQLRATSTGSLGKTLERLPGVSNMTGGPAAGNPVLRGLSQGRIRIVRDGVPQESFEASPRWFPPGNLSSVDRIEVIRGPASILFGSNALGGAINIMPRPLPASDNGGLRLYGLAESQYFSNNNERYGHGEIAGALGAIGVRAGGARRVANNFRTPHVAPYATSGVQGAPKFAGRVPYSNFEHTSSYAQAGIARAWGNARVVYDGWEGSNNFLNANGKPVGVHSRNDDVRLQSHVVVGTFVVKPSVVLQRVRIQRAATVAKSYEVATDSALWDQDLSNRIVTSRVEVAHPALRGFRGTLGAEYSAQSSVTSRSQIQPSGNVRNAAAFAFEEFRRDRLTLSAGVRADARTQNASAGTLVQALPPHERAGALRQSFHVITGSIGSALQVSEPLSVSANISTGFRAPSFLDLYTNENRPALGGWVEGNPLAKPERSTSTEVGVHYTVRRANVGVVGYRNAFRHFTYLSRSARTHALNGATVPVFATVQSPGHLSGIELNGAVEVIRSVVLDASYAAIRTRNLKTTEQLPLMPADLLRGSVRYTPSLPKRVEAPYVQLGVKHAWAKRIAGPTEPFADGGQQGFGVASTPAYWLVDVGFGGQVDIGASAIEVHVTLDNALNVAYRDFLDTQKGFTLGAGRNLGVRVAVPLVFRR